MNAEDVVPLHLLTTRFGRSEMGLNFGGNHFLEVQVVDEILDPVATRWGLREGQVVVMYHLGPGPFSGTLLHHYSRRTKLKSHRVPMFFLSKLFFHYVQRFGRANASRAWALHFRHNRWTPFPVDSEEGRVFRAVLGMALNFGFAYRLGTVRAIMDGLAETISPTLRSELLCDISHNGITRETWGGHTGWVARHNACRLAPGRPAIVAGSYDVASYLGVGLDGGDGQMHSYDHGAGNLIEHFRERDQLAQASGSVMRLKMTRGKNAEVVRRTDVPMHAAAPIDLVMECLERNRIVRPAVRLRPIGNFKN
jgi:tRNA-splicing ligase RtcB